MSASDEVLRFMDSFQRLRDFTGNSPARLKESYHKEEKLRAIADETANAAWPFELDELLNPNFSIAPVDPAFIKAWRDYNSRFAPLLRFVVITFSTDPAVELSYPEDLAPQEKWERVNCAAKHDSACVAKIINLAEEEFEFRKEDVDDIDFEMEFERGFQILKRWLPGVGLDVQLTMRRSALLGRVFVPRQVEAKSGKDVTGLVSYLDQAQKSFLLGMDFGAVVLLRSLLELTLRRHYQSEIGCDLTEKNDYGGFKNSGLNTMLTNWKASNDLLKERAMKIKKLADNLIHGGDFSKTRRLMSDCRELELEMMEHFNLIREIIESAPD